jgi:predicted Zn-dependent protease
MPLRERFGGALTRVAGGAGAGEILAGWLRAERSDFVRFNHGRIRQAGTVERAVLELRLISAGRQARHTLTLCGDRGIDDARVDEGIARLRSAIAIAQPDPYLSFSETATRSLHHAPARLASVDEISDAVCGGAQGADLVGFYAGGPLACALISSLGHDHWQETSTWSLEYSIYPGAGGTSGAGIGTDAGAAARDRALKACVAGAQWSADAVRDSITTARRDAEILRRPALRLEPGRYRCYLSPRALADLVEMLGWGGFSARAHANGHSPLSRLRNGEATLDPRVSISEDLLGAGAPLFQADGFMRPPRLELVRAGRYGHSLVSPRSGREFRLPENGAVDSESPEALSIAAGELDERQALARLGTGLEVSNLWYLNFSDRQNCRITGMTRFATLWVENGEPVAPVEVMRFDDSLFRVLGDSLEALTTQRHRLPDTSTYDGRGFGATTAPGALLRELNFTL